MFHLVSGNQGTTDWRVQSLIQDITTLCAANTQWKLYRISRRANGSADWVARKTPALMLQHDWLSHPPPLLSGFCDYSGFEYKEEDWRRA